MMYTPEGPVQAILSSQAGGSHLPWNVSAAQYQFTIPRISVVTHCALCLYPEYVWCDHLVNLLIVPTLPRIYGVTYNLQ